MPGFQMARPVLLKGDRVRKTSKPSCVGWSSRRAPVRADSRRQGISQQTSQSGAGGEVAAEAVHASARRRRGRTDVEALCRGGIRVETYHRPGQKLAEVHVAAANVATDEVGVLAFKLGRPGDGLREYALSEAGGEAFDLAFYPARHVEGRAVGDVAVRPHSVLALRSARGVEEALLGEQDKGPLRVLSPGDGGLARGDFLQRPTEVHGPGTPALLRSPGYRTIEREVDLEDAGPVAVALEGPPIPLREVLAGNGEELSRRNVEEDHSGTRYLLRVTHPEARVDLAPQGDEVRGERVGYLLR